MSNYIKPEDVTSPKEMELTHIIYDGGAQDLAVARGTWHGKKVLLMRWNGTDEKIYGQPISSAKPIWLVVPEWLQTGLLTSIAKRIEEKLK